MRTAHNKRLCVAVEEFEDTTMYFYDHNIFDQTSISGPAAMTWPLQQDSREREAIAKEMFEDFFPQQLTCRLPDSELSCDLSYQVETGQRGNLAEAITIYTVGSRGNPLSIRLAMCPGGEEVANTVLLRQFEEWFEAVLPELLKED